MQRLEGQLPLGIAGQAPDAGRFDITNRKDGLAERWRTAPAHFLNYDAGITPDGRLYEKGRRLVIDVDGQPELVMDTCEKPLVEATVRAALANLEPGSNPQVLIRGFGLGIDFSLVTQTLIGLGGGSVHIIELNEEVAEVAEMCAEATNESIANMGRANPETQPNIEIVVFKGDAAKITADLFDAGHTYNSILSDTYPLDKEEIGLNDLLDAGTVKKLLRPGGTFAFFGYYPGYEDDLNSSQKTKVLRNFIDLRATVVNVNPPPEYTYLYNGDKPVLELTSFVCSRPRP